ncbi:hypothetical protein RRF57_008091 [Xylaria bambusicola]|uniref:Uncharacterized protein n=1 Tax=Xylaria bambusicola TaxID=326684 RepID=A0AAN7Z7Z8_9PEZI
MLPLVKSDFLRIRISSGINATDGGLGYGRTRSSTCREIRRQSDGTLSSFTEIRNVGSFGITRNLFPNLDLKALSTWILFLLVVLFG